jgi:hypothetical protein
MEEYLQIIIYLRNNIFEKKLFESTGKRLLYFVPPREIN